MPPSHLSPGLPSYQLRIARPVRDLARSRSMYCAGLGLEVIGGFEDHDGFDGVMLGKAGMGYHLEFTYCRAHPVLPASTQEDLLVLYLPESRAWLDACDKMVGAGFLAVSAFNPYWNICGRTFEDGDGYRIVLQNASWTNQSAFADPSTRTGG
ncbi:VOC family protein [Variovorax sp. MHTC-1]|uniref:VOC family protein n=1 Tax=Variovorax sp. MHTC-1 TaxID=2495593 RepID=UPI000F860A8A|nr:VOC family protein [Variovorax sp. MHTC-1]RST54991.1 VOC family protein [Variovorax sp. MHTC-1]